MKIGILLLTITNPYFPDNIQKYLNDSVVLYIHPKYPEQIENKYKKYIIDKKKIIETGWAKFSLVEATINLLEESINDGCDYVYLISGDTFILNKPTLNKCSCFNFIKKYDIHNKELNILYKTAQWWGLTNNDAKIIINTRHKYKKIIMEIKTDIKIDGAYDELYFLSVLKNENKNYVFENKQQMYVKWLNNVKYLMHPITFNKLTTFNMFSIRNYIFMRKCSKDFKYEITNTKKTLYIFIIGTETNRKKILDLDLENMDYIILDGFNYNVISIDIEERIMKNMFYRIPVLWKQSINAIYSLLKDPLLSQWKNIIILPEVCNYTDIFNNKIIKMNDFTKSFKIKDCDNNIVQIFLNNNDYIQLFKKIKQNIIFQFEKNKTITNEIFLNKINNIKNNKQFCIVYIHNNKIDKIINNSNNKLIDLINELFKMIVIYNLQQINGIYIFYLKPKDTNEIIDFPTFYLSKTNDNLPFYLINNYANIFNNVIIEENHIYYYIYQLFKYYDKLII